MHQDEKVSLTISIAKEYRDRLRTMAAEQNLQDPDRLTSASTIAREIITAHLDRLTDQAATPPQTPDIEAKESVKGDRVE